MPYAGMKTVTGVCRTRLVQAHADVKQDTSFILALGPDITQRDSWDWGSCLCPQPTGTMVVTSTSACAPEAVILPPSSPSCPPPSGDNGYGCVYGYVQWSTGLCSVMAGCKAGYVMGAARVIDHQGNARGHCICATPPVPKLCTTHTMVRTCEDTTLTSFTSHTCLLHDGEVVSTGYTTNSSSTCKCVGLSCDIEYAVLHEGGSVGDVEAKELDAARLQLAYYSNNPECPLGPCLTLGSSMSPLYYINCDGCPIRGDMIYIYKDGELWSNSSILEKSMSPLRNTIILEAPFLDATTGEHVALPANLTGITISITSPLGCSGTPRHHTRCDPVHGVSYLWGNDWDNKVCLEGCERWVSTGDDQGYCSPAGSLGPFIGNPNPPSSVSIVGNVWDSATFGGNLVVTVSWDSHACEINWNNVGIDVAPGAYWGALQSLSDARKTEARAACHGAATSGSACAAVTFDVGWMIHGLTAFGCAPDASACYLHICTWKHTATEHAICHNAPTCCNGCGGRSVARLEAEGFPAATCERVQSHCDYPFATGEGSSEWPPWVSA